MNRYIDADKLPRHGRRGGLVYWRDIEAQPTADVVPMDFHDRCMEIEIQKRMNMVEVVRCKDCKKREHCRTTNTWAVAPSDDWFCADGERAEK